MPTNKVKEFLDTQHVRYASISHSVAYTAQGIAALAHVSGKELAKTVIVNIDGILAMAVLPATRHVDLRQLKIVTGAVDVKITPEEEFKNKFPDCEPGAMPPFGNLYDMQVYVDLALAEDKEIAFNAGSHHELIRMSYADFERLVQPLVAEFARQPVAA